MGCQLVLSPSLSLSLWQLTLGIWVSEMFFPPFIPQYPGQAWHIVDFQKNGHWMDEDTFAITEPRFSTQSHKENAPNRNIPNKPYLAYRWPLPCDPCGGRDNGVEYLPLIQFRHQLSGCLTLAALTETSMTVNTTWNIFMRVSAMETNVWVFAIGIVGLQMSPWNLGTTWALHSDFPFVSLSSLVYCSPRNDMHPLDLQSNWPELAMQPQVNGRGRGRPAIHESICTIWSDEGTESQCGQPLAQVHKATKEQVRTQTQVYFIYYYAFPHCDTLWAQTVQGLQDKEEVRMRICENTGKDRKARGSESLAAARGECALPSSMHCLCSQEEALDWEKSLLLWWQVKKRDALETWLDVLAASHKSPWDIQESHVDCASSLRNEDCLFMLSGYFWNEHFLHPTEESLFWVCCGFLFCFVSWVWGLFFAINFFWI